MSGTLQNFEDAEKVLLERGIAARLEWPGNLFVDCADGTTWGFTNGLNREDDLLEIYFYPDQEAVETGDSTDPLVGEAFININGETASGERLAAEISARILAHYAPKGM
jgi:hypothetical protein